MEDSCRNQNVIGNLNFLPHEPKIINKKGIKKPLAAFNKYMGRIGHVKEDYMKRKILVLMMVVLSTFIYEGSAKAYSIKADSIKEATDIQAIQKDYTGFEYIKGIPLSFDIQEYIWNISLENKIDSYLIYAMIEVESGYDEGAVSKDNHDYGLMQIRTINHTWINDMLDDELDYLNAKDNVAAGVFLLSDLYEKYYDNSGVHCVLMAYNMGEGGAKQLWEKGQFSSEYSRNVVKVYEEIKAMGSEYIFGG